MKWLIIALVAVATLSFASAIALGGYRPLPVDDSHVKSAANLAIQRMVSNNKNENGLGIDLVEVKSAQYKVIAGIQYILKMNIKFGPKVEECEVTITHRADVQKWYFSSKDDQCSDSLHDPASPPTPARVKNIKHGLLGGMEGLDAADPLVQEAANWAVNNINSMSNSMYRQVLLKIAHGSRQVVNGYKYKMLLYLTSTTCRNTPANSDKGLEDCPPANDKPMRQQCDVSVYYSNGEYSMLDFKCKPLKAILGGDDHDYKPHERVKSLLGGDDHDYKPHEKIQNLLGGDDHDYKLHERVKTLLGGDDHDYKPHERVKTLLGGDDHDYKPHEKIRNLLGGDDHDCKPHEKIPNLLGGDDHDYKPLEWVKTLLGGDDHDYKLHERVKTLLGGDDHDYKPHEKIRNLLGGDDHDYKSLERVKTFLGGDDHDYKPHEKIRNLLGGDGHDYIPHLKSLPGLMNANKKGLEGKVLAFSHDMLHEMDGVKKMSILGGDTHDYEIHRKDPCVEHRAAFEEFKLKHKRLYDSRTEEIERFQVFCTNMEKVKDYQKMEQGSAKYGATQFADLSEKEFKSKYLGLKKTTEIQWPSAEIPKGPIPDSWDWRDHNAVTPVKNQGTCGSCWAFSTTGNIEGMNAIKHKKLMSFSEQELLDCDKVDLACNGGLPSQAYEAIMKLGGLETEKNYSYDGAKEECQFNKSKVAVKVVGALNISQNEDEIAAWLYHNGPISIGINAFAMQFYFGGIAHPWKIFCRPSGIDHGVLIVGYGKDGNKPYWIIKNSWGSSWGREGYYYVYRGDGVCGLNTMCTSAVVA